MAHPEFASYKREGSRRLRNFYDAKSKELPQGEGGEENDIPVKKGKPSIFNRHSLFHYAHGKDQQEPEGLLDHPDYGNDNQPTEEDGGSGTALSSQFTNPDAKTIIDITRGEGYNAMYYEWGDFLWGKDYGRVPNNYMVTLRRFGAPAEDNLLDKEMNPNPDIGRMVTWMDGDDNALNDIMSFSVGMNWEELEAEVQTLDANKTGFGSMLPGGIAQSIGQGNNERSLQGEQRANFDPVENYKNRIYGPIDVIDKQLRRGRGLNFEQELSLVFKFQMRSYDGLNPKAAMLDLLSNVLAVTYARGEFWGGETRFAGAGKATQAMGDPNKLMNGDFGGYLDSMLGDLFGNLGSLTGGGGQNGSGNSKSLGENIGAMLGGMALDKMGRPEIQAINALLSGQATGEHHLTIGNPLNPICMIGNLALQDTEISMEGPLGVDDFPSVLRAEVTLKHARPRDKWDVESMFNGGRGRMYGHAIDTIEKDYYMNVQKGDDTSDRKAAKETETENVNDANEKIIEEDRFSRFPHFLNDSQRKSRAKEQSRWL